VHLFKLTAFVLYIYTDIETCYVKRFKGFNPSFETAGGFQTSAFRDGAPDRSLLWVLFSHHTGREGYRALPGT